MHDSNVTADVIVSRGEELYQRNIRAKVEADHKGRFLVVDIETGDYAIADEDLDATDRLLSKHPNALVYGLRIGFPAAYRIGFKISVPPQLFRS